MKFIVIILCKLLSCIGRLLGKGTSLPGQVALKLCPNILSRLQLPEHIIAVTGSNGKTSTVEMIARVLEADGRKVIWNKEGSNQIEGVTTLLLNHADLSGKVHGDVVLLESDERFARLTFRHIKPTVFAITNLYRDQLTRNGHPYRIYDYIRMAVELIPDARLLLNADDPIVRQFGLTHRDVVYFGMEKNGLSTDRSDALFNDCHYCPVCKEPLHYDYFHYTHLGGYHCPACGYSRPQCAYSVESIDLENRKMTLCGHSVDMEYASKYNVYNYCTTYAVCSMMGVDGELTARILSEFTMRSGRVVRFRAGENQGLLITSKHENSTSYNQSLSYIRTLAHPFDLVILVDAISRKYYTSETSWLWDISFEMLDDSRVNHIYLTGKYAYDLALRFQLTNIDPGKITVEPDIGKTGQAIRQGSGRAIYAVTCFSDKEKLFAQVNVTGPVAK